MSRKILIVDDSPTIRITIKESLEKLGVPAERIEVASSGHEAIARFDRFQPGLVLLDLVLPDIDGYDVATRLLAKDPRLKIAIITGAKEDDPRLPQLLSLGVFEIVRKPIRSDRLEQLLNLLEKEEQAYRRIRS